MVKSENKMHATVVKLQLTTCLNDPLIVRYPNSSLAGTGPSVDVCLWGPLSSTGYCGKPGKVNSHSTKRLEDVVYDQHVSALALEELTRARSFT